MNSCLCGDLSLSLFLTLGLLWLDVSWLMRCILTFLRWNVWSLKNLALALFHFESGLWWHFTLVGSCSHSATVLSRHLLRLLREALSTSRGISSLSSLNLRELLLLGRWVDRGRKLLCPYISITVLRLVLLLPISNSRWSTCRIFNTAASSTIESI